MNREIKFRIWSFNEKQFHYFDVLEGFSGHYGAWSEPQQFAGLKDKAGKEIYEGDIIKYSEHKGYTLSDFIAEVVFDEGKACFGFREYILINSFSEFHEIECDFLPYTEVIGNVFENPEMAHSV